LQVHHGENPIPVLLSDVNDGIGKHAREMSLSWRIEVAKASRFVSDVPDEPFYFAVESGGKLGLYVSVIFCSQHVFVRSFGMKRMRFQSA
jgi:hypothetical protein